MQEMMMQPEVSSKSGELDHEPRSSVETSSRNQNMDGLRDLGSHASNETRKAWQGDPRSSEEPAINALAAKVFAGLTEDIKNSVQVIGISVSPFDVVDRSPVEVLAKILTTGIVQAKPRLLKDYLPSFDNPPFILISNRGEDLVTEGRHLFCMRTVFVNMDHESIIDDLRMAFPEVSFRRSVQINDELFEKIDPPYRTPEEIVRENGQ